LLTGASRQAVSERPIRRLIRSDCLRAARLLYLEGRLTEGGYFSTLSEPERAAAETTVSWRRLWEAELAIVRIRLARGEIDLGDAVGALEEEVGLPRPLAAAVLRAASASRLSPACGLWGERSILELRQAFRKANRPLEALHEALWRFGELPFWAIREQLEIEP
jgi:hypothetical protein